MDHLFSIFFSPVFDNRDIGIGLSLTGFRSMYGALLLFLMMGMVAASRESLTRAITQPR